GRVHRHVQLHGLLVIPSRSPLPPFVLGHGARRRALAVCENGSATMGSTFGYLLRIVFWPDLHPTAFPAGLGSTWICHSQSQSPTTNLVGIGTDWLGVVRRAGRGRVFSGLDLLTGALCHSRNLGGLHAKSEEIH